MTLEQMSEKISGLSYILMNLWLEKLLNCQLRANSIKKGWFT